MQRRWRSRRSETGAVRAIRVAQAPRALLNAIPDAASTAIDFNAAPLGLNVRDASDTFAHTWCGSERRLVHWRACTECAPSLHLRQRWLCAGTPLPPCAAQRRGLIGWSAHTTRAPKVGLIGR